MKKRILGCVVWMILGCVEDTGFVKDTGCVDCG